MTRTKAKDLEQRDGISRSEIEQFVKKYEKLKSAPPGPGREINVKPGEQESAKPSPNLPALDPNTKFSTKTKTDRGSMPQDEVQNNCRGPPLPAASGIASASTKEYKNRLSKVYGPKRAPKAAPKNGQ